MKCPRCEDDVLWTVIEAVQGGIKLYDRGEFVTMVAVNADEIVRMSSGFAVTSHECSPVIPDEYEKSDEGSPRCEFWVSASKFALDRNCTRCGAIVGDPCRDRRYTNDEHRTSWPHKERFVDHMSPDIIENARARGWL